MLLLLMTLIYKIMKIVPHSLSPLYIPYPGDIIASYTVAELCRRRFSEIKFLWFATVYSERINYGFE
jgi:hypothetical protein